VRREDTSPGRVPTSVSNRSPGPRNPDARRFRPRPGRLGAIKAVIARSGICRPTKGDQFTAAPRYCSHNTESARLTTSPHQSGSIMQHRRYRAPHVPDHPRNTDRPRHEARLPVGQRLAPPFAYDPQSGMVIAPWQRGELHPEDEQRLAAGGRRSSPSSPLRWCCRAAG
jgi:hypothetical protein